MNESVKTMTVAEIAEVLGITPDAVRKQVRKYFPSIIKDGVTTRLTVEQVAVLMLSRTINVDQDNKKFLDALDTNVRVRTLTLAHQVLDETLGIATSKPKVEIDAEKYQELLDTVKDAKDRLWNIELYMGRSRSKYEREFADLWISKSVEKLVDLEKSIPNKTMLDIVKRGINPKYIESPDDLKMLEDLKNG
jgi:predicted transcriptional regulator